ncbi:hypothetical protein EPUS_08431 [Endocarpon pusillum Z07020]|uniref:Uncharacterized protein n=1 Tax=Endocarpon pusillum (strain Z07020 / HMAS-L-300199) TaxID=1263415 RepID=U1GU23_ENDPU|nr:uncharacterized protein EPUS_08431 [Endocarpon pusillum Z07020]ERF75526.1 hypothetical protein EPUS_08431 [Endocarpon pusillum Z07020]
MAANQSRDNQNEVSQKAPRKKGKWPMEENKKPDNTDNSVRETQEQKLERLQKQEITKLGVRIRQQSSEPTTSPQTLIIARKASFNLQAAKNSAETQRATCIASSTAITHGGGTKNGVEVETGPKVACQIPEVLLPATSIPVQTMKNGDTAPNDVNAHAKDSRQEPKDRSLRSSTISTRGRRGARFNNTKNPRWATSAEVKPPPAPPKSIDSNAFGSEVPSDAQTGSGDSLAAMENGKLLRKNRPAGVDAPLADWSGNWMPPPVDWDVRPRFNTNSVDFIGDLGHWKQKTAAQSLNTTTGLPFTRLPMGLVENADLHPDGLSLVDPSMSVNVDNAEVYGYSGDAIETIQHDANLIDPGIFTADWGKLDLRNPDNLKFQNECCNDLLRNYNAAISKEREQEINLKRAQKLARKREGPIIQTPNPHTPRINIYLRPAVRSDIPQLQDIYNSYIQNSVRPSELHSITYSHMMTRWTDSTSEKLPFIVAASKSAKINRGVGNAVEKIVGWASATDWVSAHSIERFTVELEIYVHQQHLHQGIGKCLMDKLIDSTDRGHIARKGYPFACAPELRHEYSAGGARDLMTLVILVRGLSKPQNAKEDDVPWIKKWLEDEWNFEQQGHVSCIGAKFQRYVNSTTFVRSTAYKPKEQMIPEEYH